MAQPRVIIVGGGFGGLAAAKQLRRAPAQVMVLDKQNHHLFQPLLYQVATAALSPANIAAPIRRILSSHRGTEVMMAEVSGVDLERRTIRIVDQDYAYDYLILATGAQTNYFGRDEWANHAPGLKTIDEAIDVRCRFLLAFEQAEIEADAEARRAALTFAIVGAGPTGVEMAGALAEISRHTLRKDFRHFQSQSARVILIDAAERVLPGFDERLSQRAHRDLENMGVEILLGRFVSEVDSAGLSVTSGDQTQRIDAKNIIWAAGVRAEGLGKTLGVPTDSVGRVLVRDDLSVPGHPEVFIVGDLAHRIDPKSGEQVPGVAQGAIQMGRFAGRTVAASLLAARSGTSPPARGVFVYRDKGMMATIGRNKAVADIGPWRFGGVAAWLAWALVHVVFLVTFRRKVFAMAEWIGMYFFYERGVRLITGRYAGDGSDTPLKGPPPDRRLPKPSRERSTI